DVATGERIVVNGNHHDRQRPRNGKRRLQADFRANSKNDVRHASREPPVAGFVPICVRSLQKIKGEILSFLITELTHAPSDDHPLRLCLRVSGESADSQHLLWLLRPRRERPCDRRAAEQRDELAPPHSITSSARARSVGGSSMPSAFAVV